MEYLKTRHQNRLQEKRLRLLLNRPTKTLTHVVEAVQRKDTMALIRMVQRSEVSIFHVYDNKN